MCMLIHTHPKSSAAETRSARDTSFVHTDNARPYSTPLAPKTPWPQPHTRCRCPLGWPPRGAVVLAGSRVDERHRLTTGRVDELAVNEVLHCRHGKAPVR